VLSTYTIINCTSFQNYELNVALKNKMFKREKSKKGCKQTGVATIKANKEVHENAKAKQQ
jgi:hypothetical protein